MLKITVVAVGKIKEKYYLEAIKEYAKRLTRFVSVEFVEFDEITTANNLEKEALLIMPKLNGYVIVLDKGGITLSSEEFAKKIDDVATNKGKITFVIGSSNGLDDTVKNKADMLFSFGKITLPHSLARVTLFEQLYRAESILNGGKYHK